MNRVSHHSPSEDAADPAAHPALVPVSQKLAFGVGSVADNLILNSVINLANPIYTLVYGLSPFWVGIALAVPRLWDAFLNPVIGNFSDNFRSRWGRRKPFVIAGAMTAGICYVFVWTPPAHLGGRALFAYFLGTSLVYSTCGAVFSVPWTAMGFELTPNYNERTRVMAVKTLFSNLSGFLVQWQYALVQLALFGSILIGIRWIALLLAFLIAFSGWYSGAFCRESYSPEVKRQTKLPLLASIRETLRIKPFVILLAAFVLIQVGLFTVNSLGLYLNIYFVHGGDTNASAIMNGWAGISYQLTGILSIPFITALSVRVGKRNALLLTLALAVVATASKWYCYTPRFPVLLVVPNILLAPGLTALGIIILSMIADVCDLDELTNGTRREGIFSSVYSWVYKCGLSLTFFLSGLVLKESGFDGSLSMQSARTLWEMRICFSVLPATALIAGIVLIWRYPLTARRASETRELLALRRTQAPVLR